MPFSPWLALGAVLALLGAFLAGNVHGSRAKDTEWQAKWAKFQADAFALAAGATEKARAAENANADLSAKLEKERHDADIKTADKDAAVRTALARMRGKACAGRNRVPGTEATAGAADAARGGQSILADRIDDYLARCSRGAAELAAYATECHSWAASLTK